MRHQAGATVGSILAVAALCLVLVDEAGAEDLHRLWDQRCGYCHGHSGEFARKSLGVVDGRLIGKINGEQVGKYLERHNGGYSSEIIAGMIAMLKAQAQTPNLFEEHCSECHGTAARFVRESVVKRDGRLYGKSSGRDIAAYLRRHGGLDSEQIPLMVGVLDRIDGEVRRP